MTEDLRWLRKRRQRFELVMNRLVIGIVSILLAGAGLVLWAGIKMLLNAQARGTPPAGNGLF